MLTYLTGAILTLVIIYIENHKEEDPKDKISLHWALLGSLTSWVAIGFLVYILNEDYVKALWAKGPATWIKNLNKKI